MNNDKTVDNGVSVIMPSYNQASFISIAINSLLNQHYKNWELIVINDGSTDDTDEIVNLFADNKQIFYYRNSDNLGLGKSLNMGIEYATFSNIAYLPSDDLFFPEHLGTLFENLKMYPSSILAFSGVLQANYNVMGSTESDHKRNIKGMDLQLVQVMHKKNSCKWMERSECITDDYSKMYWEKLSALGAFIPTNQVTCQWVAHPNQRHKKISSSNGGGLNIYRSYYNVKTPLTFKPKNSGLIDEVNLYRKFREKKTVCEKYLKILIVGELLNNNSFKIIKSYGWDFITAFSIKPPYAENSLKGFWARRGAMYGRWNRFFMNRMRFFSAFFSMYYIVSAVKTEE